MEESRLKAAKNGETFYEGKECIRGHGTTRYVLSGMCRECQKQKSARRYAYIKEVVKTARGVG